MLHPQNQPISRRNPQKRSLTYPDSEHFLRLQRIMIPPYGLVYPQIQSNSLEYVNHNVPNVKLFCQRQPNNIVGYISSLYLHFAQVLLVMMHITIFIAFPSRQARARRYVLSKLKQSCHPNLAERLDQWGWICLEVGFLLIK